MRREANASAAASNQCLAFGFGKLIRGAFATRDASRDAEGSGASSAGRRALLLLAAAALALLALAPSACAVMSRAKVATFGQDGTSATAFGQASQLAFDQAAHRLYVLNLSPESEREIYGFDASAPGTYTPLGGNFPISVGPGGGSPDLVVDNTVVPSSTVGNLYYESESSKSVEGYDASGNPLGSPFPIVPTSPTESVGAGVDPSGNLWIGDWQAQKAREFNPTTGSEIGSVDTSSIGRPAHLAFDSNGDMYIGLYQGATYKLTASSGYDPAQATLIDPETTRAVSVDRTAHRVYVAHSGGVAAYDASGTLLYEFAKGIPGEGLSGVAVDEATDTVYVSDEGNGKVYGYSAAQSYGNATATLTPAAGVTATTATIGANITDNNALPTRWRLELSEDQGGTWSSVESGETSGGQANVQVSKELTGLIPHSEYEFRIVTNKGPGSADVDSSPLALETAGEAPFASEVGAVEVEDTSARLVGTINPRNSVTSYVFEYGATPAFGASTAPLIVGEGTTPIVVSQLVSGLAKDTTYHFRLSATNAFGTTHSTEATLRTRSEPAPLPDHRAYEQISPVRKNFGDAVPPSFDEFPRAEAVAIDGEGIAYGSVNSFDEKAAQNVKYRTQYVSGRGANGWWTRSAAPPTCANDLDYPVLFATFFPTNPRVSANVDHMVFPQREAQTCPRPPLDPAAPVPDTNLYRTNVDEGAPSYELLTPVKTTEIFFEKSKGLASQAGIFTGGSDDFSHVIYESVGQQTPDAPAGEFYKLFEWDNGTLRLASIDPNGNPFSTDSAIAAPGFGTEISRRRGDAVNAVSADGARFYFQNPVSGPSREIYLREEGTHTYKVSESECTVECGSSAQQTFWWADRTGDEALLSTEQKLLNADSQAGVDLYAYRQSQNPGSEENLTLISKDNEPADGVGTGAVEEREELEVLGMSDDGSEAYFVAPGQLVAGQPTAPGPKIYRWSWNEGNPTLQYLATAELTRHDLSKEVVHWERRVSQEGNALMIETAQRIDPTADHDSDIDVYLWREGKGWSCVSCQTPGAPSRGPSTTSLVGQSLTSFALVEPPMASKLSSAISEDGERVVFTSEDALVPQDTNGPCAQVTGGYGYYPCTDIYEWHDGKISLLTPGDEASDVSLLGMSASGRDVFFFTRQRLVGWDNDGYIDVYDARIGGGFPEPSPQPAPCEGEACRGQGTTAPGGAGAGTAVFQGPGNPAPKHRKHAKHRKRHTHTKKHKHLHRKHPNKRDARDNWRAGR